jgi:hypothetical protein
MTAPTTVTAFELELRRASRPTLAGLTGALEAAGIMFVQDGTGEISVALRKS